MIKSRSLMMARLLEERQEEDVVEDTLEQEVTEQEPQEDEGTQVEQTETEVPEKYQGKSTAEIVRMHQEAEKLLVIAFIQDALDEIKEDSIKEAFEILMLETFKNGEQQDAE